jgi:glucose/arabinose dehydrogenase
MSTQSSLTSLLLSSLLMSFWGSLHVQAATVPTGFIDSMVANGLSGPTAMAIAPDGRVFITQQGGQLRVVKAGSLLSTPFLAVPVDSSGERGLLGVAFDPNFASNGFVYVYYTATTPNIHNRVSRFTASGDVALAGSETILLELDPLSSATNHNGGALHFGLDGKLYVAVGDNANGTNAQSLGTLNGKMLRINSDGTIPSDNPFFGTAIGKYGAIWALGLRNPFTFAIQPNSSRMFINDVGQDTWEEINDGSPAANYGWPETEGPTQDPRFVSPLYAYNQANGGCAIVGGAFYNPGVEQFPGSYVGTYFFADLCSGWIRNLNPSSPATAANFASGVPNPVDLAVDLDGSLYYLARGNGSLNRVRFATVQTPPITSITFPENGATVPRRQTVNITASASAASGSAISRVEFYVNNSLTCTDTTAPYSCAWRVPSPPRRRYQLQTRAFDTSGSQGQSSVVEVTSSR